MDGFITWLVPRATKEGRYTQVADLLTKQFSSIEVTLDAYGEGPGEHGAAYKAPGDLLEPIAQALLKQGFRRQKNKLTKGNVVVELGSGKDETFFYITDDNP